MGLATRMKKLGSTNPYATPEQLRYARVLEVGVGVGFVTLVLSFAAYVIGLIEPYIPVDQLPAYWGLPAREFVKATNTPTGWGWVPLVRYGDMLNLVGIAILAGVSAVSSLAILPIFARRGERAVLFITVLQIVVLIVSASNVFAGAR
jgi:hypothetical protein